MNAVNIMSNPKTEVVICRLCLEPLYNFICIDCLLDASKLWLRKKGADEIIPAVEQRHKEVKSTLSSDYNTMVCIKCKQETNTWACPCCYLHEVYEIIKKERPDLANNFEQIFNFDFHYTHGFTQLTFWQSLHRQSLSTKNFRPVIIVDKRNDTDFNICERCEQAADDLKEVNGEWVCEDCRDSEEFE